MQNKNISRKNPFLSEAVIYYAGLVGLLIFTTSFLRPTVLLDIIVIILTASAIVGVIKYRKYHAGFLVIILVAFHSITFLLSIAHIILIFIQ